MKTCEEDIRRYQPDVVILIDYPGFNMKIAKFVKTVLHLPVYYYISPKIWAWKQYRIKDFRRYVDRMFCILPFETEFFHKLNYSVDYVGNPLVDSVAQYKEKQAALPDTFMADERLPDKPILALLAGSRRQEIKDNLPTMLEVAASYPDYQPVIAELQDSNLPITNSISATILPVSSLGKLTTCCNTVGQRWLLPGRQRSRHPCSVCRR